MINLKLVTLSGVHFDDAVFEVVIPTMAGDIAVNEGHAPLLSVASPGLVAIRKERKVKDDDREFVAIYGGTVEVLGNTITVLVDDVDTASGVNEAEAELAYKRALELKDNAKDEVSLQEAKALVDRSAVRLKLAGVRKRSHRH